jgi:pimeloyl-ACP methyl ester carboxylesterase
MIYSPLQSITLDNWRIKYRVLGNGPDVLLLHGWASSSRMWQRLMNDLAGRYRCIALDLPGFGESDKPEGSWYSIAHYVEIVAQFARALELTNPVVFGHSMGGMIALAAAGEGSMPMSRMVAINPVVTGKTYWDLRLLSDSPLSTHAMSFGHWFWPIVSGDWVGPWLGAERSDQYRRMREEWQQSTPEALTGALRAVGRTDLTSALPRITTPALVLLGSRDLTAPNAEGKLAARSIPGAQLVVLPTGHLPTDDVPDATLAIIDKFLASQPALVASR